MIVAIRDDDGKTGGHVGFEAVGGVAIDSDAVLSDTIVGDILGKGWLRPGI
jgi:hypothetical protein